MRRRSFLKTLTAALTGAAVAVVSPDILTAARREPEHIKGVPYKVDEGSHAFQGLTRRWVVHPNCPPDRIYFLNTENIERLPDGRFSVMGDGLDVGVLNDLTL
ncbi:MAG TPA: twin-arginine translocation signal domain-containing protein [Pyrinomonadaceae bacterium]|jgi:hypothetical protein